MTAAIRPACAPRHTPRHGQRQRPPLSLLFALLARRLGAWGAGRPTPRFVAVVERTEAALAQAIRLSLAQEGLAYPDLDDPALLAWFKTAYPAARAGMERPVRAHRTTRPLIEFPMLCCASQHLDRRLPAGKAQAGWKPAVHRARAPPSSGSACKPNHRPAPSGRPLALALCRRGDRLHDPNAVRPGAIGPRQRRVTRPSPREGGLTRHPLKRHFPGNDRGGHLDLLNIIGRDAGRVA